MKISPFLHISEEKNNCVSIYTQEFGPLIQCLFVCLANKTRLLRVFEVRGTPISVSPLLKWVL